MRDKAIAQGLVAAGQHDDARRHLQDAEKRNAAAFRAHGFGRESRMIQDLTTDLDEKELLTLTGMDKEDLVRDLSQALQNEMNDKNAMPGEVANSINEVRGLMAKSSVRLQDWEGISGQLEAMAFNTKDTVLRDELRIAMERSKALSFRRQTDPHKFFSDIMKVAFSPESLEAGRDIPSDEFAPSVFPQGSGISDIIRKAPVAPGSQAPTRASGTRASGLRDFTDLGDQEKNDVVQKVVEFNFRRDDLAQIANSQARLAMLFRELGVNPTSLPQDLIRRLVEPEALANLTEGI
jgi:hypothetical protein